MSSYVTLKVYNLSGQEITTLFEGKSQPGNYEVMFDGSELASGIYFCSMETKKFTQIKKLMLLK